MSRDKFVLENYQDFKRAVDYLKSLKSINFEEVNKRASLTPFRVDRDQSGRENPLKEDLYHIVSIGFFRMTIKTPLAGTNRLNYWDNIDKNKFYDGLISIVQGLYVSKGSNFNHVDFLPKTKNINTIEWLHLIDPFISTFEWEKETKKFARLHKEDEELKEKKRLEGEQRLKESLNREKFERLTRQYTKEAVERAFYLSYTKEKGIKIDESIKEYLGA